MSDNARLMSSDPHPLPASAASSRPAPSSHAPLSAVTRGGVVESVHAGSVAVVDRHGRLLYTTGDAETLTFTRSHDHMLLLSATRAEQRVAMFLLGLSERYRRLGESRSRFALRMTRQDIGSYLGLQLETVSRLLSHFQREGFIQVQGREIALLDFPALWRLSGHSPDSHRPVIEPILDAEGNLPFIADANGPAPM